MFLDIFHCFRVLIELFMHFRHTGETPHRCDICKKSFTRKEHYVNHYMWHTGRNEQEFIFNRMPLSTRIWTQTHGKSGGIHSIFLSLFRDFIRWNASSMHCLWQKIHEERASSQSHAFAHKWHTVPLRNLWQMLHPERTFYQSHFMVNIHHS